MEANYRSKSKGTLSNVESRSEGADDSTSVRGVGIEGATVLRGREQEGVTDPVVKKNWGSRASRKEWTQTGREQGENEKEPALCSPGQSNGGVGHIAVLASIFGGSPSGVVQASDGDCGGLL
jgi:heme-degrading monooxygenase HmoA